MLKHNHEGLLLTQESWNYASHCTWLTQANLQSSAWNRRSSWYGTNELGPARVRKGNLGLPLLHTHSFEALSIFLSVRLSL